jgi:transcriptional regulator with XRE-family HTH domain
VSGHRKWSEVRRKGDQASEARITEYRAELDRAMTLAELRHAREMTQAQLGKALDLTQPGVSRIEHQTDLYLSTLRSYVAALGGELDVVARFSDFEIPIKQFERLDAMVVDSGARVAALEFKISDAQSRAAQKVLETAIKQIRAVLEIDAARVTKAALASAVSFDASAVESIRRSIDESTEATLLRIRETMLSVEAPDIRTSRGDRGWEIKVEPADEPVVSLSTKSGAVKVGRVLAHSTGGKFHVQSSARAARGRAQTTRSRRTRSKSNRAA